MLTSQLESVEINFEDEIRALVLLSSLLEAWDGLVMAVGVLLSEEAHQKSSMLVEISGSALSVEQRGRSENRDKKRM